MCGGGGSGIRTHGGVNLTGFQDRRLRPLGHPSKPVHLTSFLLRPQICSNLRRLLPSGCSTYGQVRLRRPSRLGPDPQRRPLRAPWVRIRGAATTAMLLHRRGAATTKTGPCRCNPSGRWGSWPISALLVVDDARASTSSSRLDLDSRDPSADGTRGPGRASWSQTPHLTTAFRPRDESR